MDIAVSNEIVVRCRNSHYALTKGPGKMFSIFKSIVRSPTAPSRVDRLTYALGDIHGRLDLLENSLKGIFSDSRGHDEKPLIILLGDYVDRGPNSRGVLDRLLYLQNEPWCEVVALMGNHEQTLLQFIKEPETGRAWADYGGASTLASYNVALPHMKSHDQEWVRVRDQFLANVPPSHISFLQSLILTFAAGDYLFVHAGVRPGQPLIEQGAETFLWIRGSFLEASKACEYVVVHGHTPVEAPVNKRWRIGIDTGAYATGVLTGVKLLGEKRNFFHIKARGISAP